jgi:hypothetical protein
MVVDFVHPDDVEKVREQLNLQPQDGSPNGGGNGRVLDLRTGTVKKDGHASGARLGKFLNEKSRYRRRHDSQAPSFALL